MPFVAVLINRVFAGWRSLRSANSLHAPFGEARQEKQTCLRYSVSTLADKRRITVVGMGRQGHISRARFNETTIVMCGGYVPSSLQACIAKIIVVVL
jgi:hypothetical protein